MFFWTFRMKSSLKCFGLNLCLGYRTVCDVWMKPACWKVGTETGLSGRDGSQRVKRVLVGSVLTSLDVLHPGQHPKDLLIISVTHWGSLKATRQSKVAVIWWFIAVNYSRLPVAAACGFLSMRSHCSQQKKKKKMKLLPDFFSVGT